MPLDDEDTHGKMPLAPVFACFPVHLETQERVSKIGHHGGPIVRTNHPGSCFSP